jgi:hypothetical protein
MFHSERQIGSSQTSTPNRTVSFLRAYSDNDRWFTIRACTHRVLHVSRTTHVEYEIAYGPGKSSRMNCRRQGGIRHSRPQRLLLGTGFVCMHVFRTGVSTADCLAEDGEMEQLMMAIPGTKHSIQYIVPVQRIVRINDNVWAINLLKPSFDKHHTSTVYCNLAPSLVSIINSYIVSMKAGTAPSATHQNHNHSCTSASNSRYAVDDGGEITHGGDDSDATTGHCHVCR